MLLITNNRFQKTKAMFTILAKDVKDDPTVSK